MAEEMTGCCDGIERSPSSIGSRGEKKTRSRCAYELDVSMCVLNEPKSCRTFHTIQGAAPMITSDTASHACERTARCRQQSHATSRTTLATRWMSFHTA